MIETTNNFIYKLKTGEEISFRELFDTYYTELCRFALVYIKDTDAAEDLVQEFFTQLWLKKDDLSINTSLKSYLFTSIRNKALNYIRDNKKFSYTGDNIELIDSSLSSNGTIENIEMEELQKIITSIIDDLPPKCKTIFLLSREENLSYKEIAHQLEISSKTVENQIGIALKRLHEAINPYLNNLLFIVFYLFFLNFL